MDRSLLIYLAPVGIVLIMVGGAGLFAGYGELAILVGGAGVACVILAAVGSGM